MSDSCIMIYYHYVRNLGLSRYPEIKGLSVERFRAQLESLARRHRFIGMEECVRAVQEGAPLPGNAVHLTFDDGFRDHFETVFPILSDMGIPASFYPIRRATLEREVLDVHKIHYTLACAPDVPALLKDVYAALDRHREEFGLDSNEHYYKKLAVVFANDPNDIVFIKRLLQRELPEKARGLITDELFAKYVALDQKVFAEELYMTLEQIKLMRKSGMFIGSHGSRHLWLGQESPESQKADMDEADELLDMIGVAPEGRVIAYPYGSYDDGLIELLKKRKYSMGLGARWADSVCTKENAFVLDRWDTNNIGSLRKIALDP